MKPVYIRIDKNNIENIHQQEKIDVLIPNFDAELFSFMKNEQRLLDKGIHTFLPTIKQFQERDKDKLPEFGKKYGVKRNLSYDV